jgi:soluble lytic murein transglycosylase-like protein
VRFVCVISAIIACLAPISAAADPTASELSVVRLGADGHLVRVRLNNLQKAAAPAKKRTASMSTPLVIAPLFTGSQNSSANPTVSDLVQDAARRYQVDPLLVHSVIRVESGFNPEAVSVKGAEGLMQLIPSTAQRFGAKNAFDPKQNIDAGVHYLKYLQDRFPNDLTLSLAAYNAGEGAVTRYNSVPPYPETVDYVKKVKREYTVRQRAAQPSRTDLPQASAQSSATEEPVRHIQGYVDSEGRLYLRTR